MNTKILLIVILALQAIALSNETFELSSGEKLSFKNSDRNVRLYLSKGKRHELLWARPKNYGELGYSAFTHGFENSIQFAFADRNKDVVSVIFKMNTIGVRERMYDRFFHPKDIGSERTRMLIKQKGDDYFLRSFIKNADGSWSSHISMNLNYSWKNLRCKDITALKVETNNSYKLTFAHSYKPVANSFWGRHAPDIEFLTEFKDYNIFLYNAESGEKEKILKYDDNDDLLYLLDDNGVKQAPPKSTLWWVGFDDFSSKNSSENVQKPQRDKYKKLNIKLLEDSYFIPLASPYYSKLYEINKEHGTEAPLLEKDVRTILKLANPNIGKEELDKSVKNWIKRKRPLNAKFTEIE